MATLRDYFLSESKDCLRQLNDQVTRFDASLGNPAELHRIAKTLRGSAQLARENRVFQAGLALETAARAMLTGSLAWNPDISGRVRRTIEDIEALVHAGRDADDDDARVRRVLERWREAGVNIPDTPMQGAAPAAERSVASKQFREFAAHEVAGITSEIETSIAQLMQDPRNRDPLKTILRRQRALLGSARLDEIGVVAETLRAVEDLVRVIAKLNVVVKDEWVAVFRAARDVLSGALEPLKLGNDPVASPALSTLRTLRTELLERYGDGAAVSVAEPPPATPSAATSQSIPVTQPESAPPTPTATAQPSPAAQPETGAATAPDQQVVPIESLCYDGERALRRALELRSRIEALAANDPDARDNVEELFDLIRLGIG